jgi:transposase-like protein
LYFSANPTEQKGTLVDRIIEQWEAVNSEKHNHVVQELSQEIKTVVQQYAEKWFERRLEKEVDRWLGRGPYRRREHCGSHRLSIACPRCGSTYQRDWVRNGRRHRKLLTKYGLLDIWLPRVKCRCGGSVSIPFEVLGRWKHTWDDLRLQTQEWASKALSLRQMQLDLARMLNTSVGLRTLNEWVHTIDRLPKDHRPLSTVPPVVLLDAIWVTRLVGDGTTYTDSAGRVRPVKKKVREAVLIALGVWPQSGRYYVLDWEPAAGEACAEWEKLLARLIDRGLWPNRGLQLMVHDGGAGLEAALRRWYAEVPSQRCVFHKLRNVWRAVVVPEEDSSRQGRVLRKQITREAAAVFRAPDRREAQRLMADFRQRWAETQPGAVATLLRDQEDTLRFYSFLERNPGWQVRALRTTSLLERVNRSLRKFFRAAGAYHSIAGLQAALHRVLVPIAIL